MAERVQIRVNGKVLDVAAGTSIAAALLLAGEPARVSTSGEPRAPLCGMGICYECRAIVDGVSNRRTCLLACRNGMEVSTL